MRIFLAFSFRNEDKELVEYLGQLVASQLVEIKTGARLGGEQLTPAVQKRIEECDALVGLLTRRDQRQDGKWTTHQWVLEEIVWARAKQRRTIALVEDGVDDGGMFQSHEFIPLRQDAPLDAVLVLSATIGLWKREVGRTVKVQIRPDALAKILGQNGSGPRCRHRLWLGGKYTDWREANPVPETGGTFVYVEGVQEDHLIQLQVEQANKTWLSLATSQWIQVELCQGGIGK